MSFSFNDWPSFQYRLKLPHRKCFISCFNEVVLKISVCIEHEIPISPTIQNDVYKHDVNFMPVITVYITTDDWWLLLNCGYKTVCMNNKIWSSVLIWITVFLKRIYFYILTGKLYKNNKKDVKMWQFKF